MTPEEVNALIARLSDYPFGDEALLREAAAALAQVTAERDAMRAESCIQDVNGEWHSAAKMFMDELRSTRAQLAAAEQRLKTWDSTIDWADVLRGERS